jgi:hypothetical protein
VATHSSSLSRRAVRARAGCGAQVEEADDGLEVRMGLTDEVEDEISDEGVNQGVNILVPKSPNHED